MMNFKKNITYKLVLLALASNVCYSYFNVTHFTLLRLLAAVLIAAFYGLAVISLFNTQRFSGRGNKLILFYLILVMAVLLFSFEANRRDIITLFFHPIAFPAFFITVIAFFAREDDAQMIVALSRKINNILPFTFLMDIFLLDSSTSMNLSYLFMLIEFLQFEKLSKSRRIYLLLLLSTTVVVKYISIDRLIVITILLTSFTFFAFRFFKFLNSRYIKSIIVLFAFLILYIFSFHFTEIFTDIQSNLSSESVDTTDTRSFLWEEFFEDFKSDDWLTGRGFLGTYYSPYFAYLNKIGQEGDYFIRFSIEIGILEFLLKGGLLILIPFIFIVLSTLKKGFINSTLSEEKFRFSIFILIIFTALCIGFRPTFNTNYIVFWTLTGIILNPPRKISQ